MSQKKRALLPGLQAFRQCSYVSGGIGVKKIHRSFFTKNDKEVVIHNASFHEQINKRQSAENVKPETLADRNQIVIN
jgi:hypothetical protein